MILLLSHADTELLAAAGSGADYRVANPARVEPDDLPGLLDGEGVRADVVVVRLLGGRSSWPAPRWRSWQHWGSSARSAATR